LSVKSLIFEVKEPEIELLPFEAVLERQSPKPEITAKA
jgi:hypothetical protein